VFRIGRNVVFPSQILIVEVEEQLAENLKAFLGRSAVDVRIASDADTATAMLGSFAPDLVILDYELPGIDGLRAYEKIVRFCPTPPHCVLIAGDITETMVQRARQHGVYQILGKPFRFSELQDAIIESMSEKQDPITGDRRFDERRSDLILSPHLNRRLTWSRRDRPELKYQGLIFAPEAPAYLAPGELP
jgi:DNA-binding response OmpR family regulator